MKWLMAMIVSLTTLTSAHSQPLAHTGVPCQTYQTLKKEHPSQHIYWETIGRKKCYHIHVPVSVQTENSVNSQTSRKGVTTLQKIDRNEEVLDWFSTPIMKWFYNEYTRGRNF